MVVYLVIGSELIFEMEKYGVVKGRNMDWI